MPGGLLITTFATWKPQQASNASDDLLQRFLDENGDACRSLRHLPVDPLLAPRMVLDAFDTLRPRVLVCCGMAEGRTRLGVEAQASLHGNVLQTDIDLAALTAGLPMTEISRDAGDFVCNTLYYRCLEHLQNVPEPHRCLFIHVPVLTEENAPGLTADFTRIIARLAAFG